MRLSHPWSALANDDGGTGHAHGTGRIRTPGERRLEEGGDQARAGNRAGLRRRPPRRLLRRSARQGDPPGGLAVRAVLLRPGRLAPERSARRRQGGGDGAALRQGRRLEVAGRSAADLRLRDRQRPARRQVRSPHRAVRPRLPPQHRPSPRHLHDARLLGTDTAQPGGGGAAADRPLLSAPGRVGGRSPPRTRALAGGDALAVDRPRALARRIGWGRHESLARPRGTRSRPGEQRQCACPAGHRGGAEADARPSRRRARLGPPAALAQVAASLGARRRPLDRLPRSLLEPRPPLAPFHAQGGRQPRSRQHLCAHGASRQRPAPGLPPRATPP